MQNQNQTNQNQTKPIPNQFQFQNKNKHRVGDGFHVFPVFADKAFSKEMSPFLMFDYAAPKQFPPTTKQLGVGQHPHRGFETITLAFQGEVEHNDNKGNRGVIGAGVYIYIYILYYIYIHVCNTM